MLSLEQKYPRFPQQFAQSSGESPLSEVESAPAPVELNPIALSDKTRLGPYSWLLKDAFEESQTDQVLQLNESDQTVDLVAIERSLTPAEKSQGLRQQLVTREKIALIVNAENPFQGTLTLQQVTQIFNGEITNWQQVGGEDLPLKLVNRPKQNQTRQALASYPVFKQAKLDANAVQAEVDTTADIVTALGKTGISYSPASEAIDQFSMRIISIDNVGVDDGRYPFSQALYYVYPQEPSEKVQGFLDFLNTPDAESAIEFAQSQPGDPARIDTQPALAALQTNAIAPATTTPPETASTPSDAIPASPLDPTPTPETLTEDPGSQATNGTAPALNASSDALSWLPLLLLFVALGVLGWLAFMRAQLAKKRKHAPRPAPNYAERLKAQGSNRDADDLKAIIRDPKQTEEDESLTAEAAPPIVPDLSLGNELDAEDISASHSSDLESLSADSEPLWDDDLTTLQAAPIPTPEVEFDEAEFALDDDDLATPPSGPHDSEIPTDESSSPTVPPLSLDSISSEDRSEETDVTLVQGVFQANPMELEDDDLTDATVIQGREPMDPLTGRVIEEDESSLEDNLSEEVITTDESTATDAQTRDASDPHWNEVADPWE